MANKQKKKRNKPYRGAEASLDRPSVTRISAVNRSKPAQWWLDNKRVAKPVGIAVLVVAVIAWLIYEVVRLTTT